MAEVAPGPHGADRGPVCAGRALSSSPGRGLLPDLPRENCRTTAEHVGHTIPDGPQHLLGRAKWDADSVLDELRAYMLEHPTDGQEAVPVVEETGRSDRVIVVRASSTGTPVPPAGSRTPGSPSISATPPGTATPASTVPCTRPGAGPRPSPIRACARPSSTGSPSTAPSPQPAPTPTASPAPGHGPNRPRPTDPSRRSRVPPPLGTAVTGHLCPTSRGTSVTPGARGRR